MSNEKSIELLEATRNGDLKQVEKPLAGGWVRKAADVNSRNDLGQTALQIRT